MNVDQRLRVLAKDVLKRLDSYRAFHVPALALVHLMNRWSFDRLLRDPSIVDIFLRAGFVRGPFYPFASDIDLVLVLDEERGRTVDGIRGALATLRKARRVNLSLRDWWQHLILRDELSLVGKHWAVFGADEWRDRRGKSPVDCGRPYPKLPVVWAAWAQLCAWSGSVFHAIFQPAGTVHSIIAGRKKTVFFSARMATLDALPGDAVTVKDLKVVRDAQTAAVAKDPLPGSSHFSDRESFRRTVRDIESAGALLRRIAQLAPATSVDGPAIVRVLVSDPAAFIVLRDGLSDRELDAAFDAIGKLDLPAVRVLHVLPESALDIWPFPAVELREFGSGEKFVPAPADPKRLYLFELLFAPSLFRLALWFDDPRPLLRRTYLSLARGRTLHTEGRFEPLPVPDLEATGQTEPLFRACSALADSLRAVL